MNFQVTSKFQVERKVMKKRFLLILIGCLYMFVIAGCNKDNDGSGNKDSSIVPIEDGDIDDILDEEKKKPSDDNFRPTVDGEVRRISTTNPITFTSSIEIVPDRVEQSLKLDRQLQEELTNGGYTFDDPLVIQNPFNISPLTAVLLFETEEESTVRVTVKGNTDETDVVGNVDEHMTRLHRVPVIGLYADKENLVIIDLLDQDGQIRDTKEITITTEALADSMDNMVEVEKYTEPSAFGLIVVSGFNTPNPIAFDTEGNIRWYLTERYASYGYFPLSNGRFLVMAEDILIPTYEKPHAQEMYEMDLLGRVHQIYYVKNGAHHEVIEKTPGGNLLIASNSIDDHVEDVVVEMDRETGETVKYFDIRDVLGQAYVDMIDWAHINTVSYVEEDDSVVLCPRNIHSGVKVNWTTDELMWILGDPQFWEGTPYEDFVLQPEGDIVWHYQPHTIYQLEEDLDGDPDTIHVMMFDNHWHGTRKIDFFDDLPYSYVTIYDINEETMTVSQSKLYEGLKSKVTSNYRFDSDAGRVFFMGGWLDYETEDGKNGMIYEYDYDTTQVLNQYSLRERFYRGYELEADFNSCAFPMEVGENYAKGILRVASINKDSEGVPSETIGDEVDLFISQQILYLGANDHQISHIEFIGNDNSYMLDLSHTEDVGQKYTEVYYYIMAPLTNLDKDEYKLVVTFEGTRYDTGETITIQ